jgi:hypothetical protein
MRAFVDLRTLSGSLKYLEIVGREIPLTAAKSSMFLIFFPLIQKGLLQFHVRTGNLDCRQFQIVPKGAV